MLPFKPNKEYTTVALYVGAVSAITIAIALFVFRFADVRAALVPVFKTLSPIALALLFAYLIRPLCSRIEKLVSRFCKRPRLSRLIAIFLSYVLVFAAIILFIFFLIPALLGDTGALGNKIVDLFAQAEALLIGFLDKLHLPSDVVEGLAATLARYYDRAIDAIVSFAQSLVLGTYKTIFAFFLAATVLFHSTPLCSKKRLSSIETKAFSSAYAPSGGNLTCSNQSSTINTAIMELCIK